MANSVVQKMVGVALALAPLLMVAISVLVRGWRKTMVPKERPLPPKIVEDSRWGEHKYIHIPNLRVHYVEKGDRSKPLMLFLHGFPDFWFAWRNQLEHFSRKYWCVAPDLRGYGDTEKPSGVEEYSIENLAGDVNNLVKALGRKQCILVGHDWGGRIGYAVCSLYPDLVSAYVACGCTHWDAWIKAQQESWSQKIKFWYAIFFQCPTVPELIMRINDLKTLENTHSAIKNKERVTEEVIEAYKFTYRDKNAFNGPINYYRAQALSEFRAGKIKVPVLSLCGTDDRYMNVETCRLSANYVEDYTERLLGGISHWTPVDAPDAVNGAIEEYLRDRNL